ncbi:MAG: hypothetical protein ACR2NP_03255 [Pirellulaceae bacterium]
MANLFKIREELLADGKITVNEVEKIKDYMASDGQLDFQDAQFLVELLKDAREVCSEFDDLLFPCLREIILRDGKIEMDEQYILLKMLYADGEVRESERRFLTELYRDVDEVTPEFKQLCETALSCETVDWSVD